MTTDIVHWVDGSALTGSPTGWAEVTNPATGQVTGRVALASEADAAHVIASASRAAGAWGTTSLARRTQVLFSFRELLNSRKDELAAIITAEHGKVHSDAMGEISRGLEVVEFACGISHLLKGGHSEEASTGIDVHSKRVPLGVVGIISPFNFPAMVPMWFFPIAIAAGNAVVLKPSEKDPSAANWLAALWQEAGLPDGVFNVLHGDKTAVDALLTSPEVQAISFVGSTPIAEYVYETASRHGKRVQALGGAKNHMVVLPDADLDLAADSAVNAGYGSAGERCMAISVLVAVDPIGDELVARIADRTRTLLVGDGGTGATGGQKEADMGPLVTRAHRDRVSSFIDSGEAAGAKVVVDGRDVSARGGEEGFWLGPTLFDDVTPDMDIYREEIFGPVLSVVRVEVLRGGRRAGQRQRVRQRHRGLHQRRRSRPPLRGRRDRRHDRRQRAGPGAGRLLLLRRLEALAVRRHPRPRHRGRPLLHPRQGRHHPVDRPGQPPRGRPRAGVPAQ